jgi:hypothetical protein
MCRVSCDVGGDCSIKGCAPSSPTLHWDTWPVNRGCGADVLQTRPFTDELGALRSVNTRGQAREASLDFRLKLFILYDDMT